jgi:hypothetical protein
MTDSERILASELVACRFVPGSFEKRFARDLASIARELPEKAITVKQTRWLRILHHRFRRQIPNHRCGLFCRLEELSGALR